MSIRDISVVESRNGETPQLMQESPSSILSGSTRVCNALSGISHNLAKSHQFLLQESKRESQSVLKEGSISMKTGFVPSTIPGKDPSHATSLPSSHAVWEKIAKNLPSLLSSYRLDAEIERMPILPVDFQDQYLDRASMLISALAHAYCFHNQRPLPPQLEIPWQEISKRLGRDRMMRTASDDFLHNWRYKNPALSNPMDISNLEVLFPYFYESEDSTMDLIVMLMEHRFAPALQQIAAAQTAVLQQEDDRLLHCLEEMTIILRKATEEFSYYLSPNQNSPYYIDPVIWAKTFGTVGKSTREGELGNSGISLPFFHVMDAFIGRTRFSSELGTQMTRRFEDFPQTYKDLVSYILEVSVREYIAHSSQECLKTAFDNLLEAYEGDNGWLGMHRKKVFGYIKLVIQSGRTDTNNEGVGNVHVPSRPMLPWEKIDESFARSNDERSVAHCVGKYHRVLESAVTPLCQGVHQITFHLNEDVSQWISGDKLSVIPENLSSKIDSIISVLGIDPDFLLPLPTNWRGWLLEHLGQSTDRLSLRSLLKYADFKQFAFQDRPFSSFLNMIHEGRLNAGQLCEQNSPFYLPSLLQPMQPRLYSLTDVDVEQKTVSLTVSMKEQETTTMCPFSGRITGPYLSQQAVKPAIFHTPSYRFTLPQDPNASIIMFAAGTGIAPFIRFIKQAPPTSRLTLYYSVKNQDEFLHGDELMAIASTGRLDMTVIFSQTGEYFEYTRGVLCKQHRAETKIHLDDLFGKTNEQRSLQALISDPHAYLYICGSSGFYKAILPSLRHNIAIDKLVATRRFVPEVYDTNPNPVQEAQPLMTLAEVAMHNSINDCYIVMNNHVYDVSQYMHLHPGGMKILMASAGLDSSRDFQIVHRQEQDVLNSSQMYLIADVKVPHLSIGQDLYNRHLTSLQFITGLQNTSFNNSYFYDREISFRLFEKDLIPYYVASMEDAERKLTQKTLPESQSGEFLQQAIVKVKTALQTYYINAKKVASDFITNLARVKLETLDAMKKLHYEFLKTIENNDFDYSTLETMHADVNKSTAESFTKYWTTLNSITMSLQGV